MTTVLAQVASEAAPDTHDRLLDAVHEACSRIAPVWPLSSFVAVNPFLGFSGMPFDQAVTEVRRLTGAHMLMPTSFYRDAVSRGRIGSVDLAAALKDARLAGLSLDRFLHAVAQAPGEPLASARITTVADVLDNLSAGDRQVSRTAFMVDEISRWCAAYFDDGQASWSAPWRSLPLYAAWRESVRHDRNARVMGVTGFADTVASLPSDALGSIESVIEALGIPADQWADYLYRALFDIRGWAAYVRRLDWEAERSGGSGAALADLLAIRVVWGYALFRQRSDEAFVRAWRAALASPAARERPTAWDDAELSTDLVLHAAYERAFQRRFIAELAKGTSSQIRGRPPVQAVFCIDVRSEVFRRSLESVWPQAETLGFAGFFGIPIAYGQGAAPAQAHCPVLITPSVALAARPEIGRAKAAFAPARSLLSRLKLSAVSCFGFVEAFGLAYGAKLLASSGLISKPLPKAPEAPALCEHHVELVRRVDLAEGALRGMSLTAGFSQLVLLAGHGSTTVNNPHAASLDCGACGGQSGAPNARFACTLLNAPEVRAGLAERGIAIPEDTWFVAALHDTTTDVFWLLDEDAIPASHRPAVESARANLAAASRLARQERARLLHREPEDDDACVARSRDWSQVRPEWGLAGAAAFIAAPRSLTAGCNLKGRAFLHSYDRHADPEGKILEMIMTAPMVVASWISLQYYGSTVDNAAFGAGDKTLHNVCGRVGVLEGNGGDLRTGLPLQSVHDGHRFVHEPLRLNVFIAASTEAIDRVMERHQDVKALLDNQWVHLFTLDDQGRTKRRYVGGLGWEVIVSASP